MRFCAVIERSMKLKLHLHLVFTVKIPQWTSDTKIKGEKTCMKDHHYSKLSDTRIKGKNLYERLLLQWTFSYQKQKQKCALKTTYLSSPRITHIFKLLLLLFLNTIFGNLVSQRAFEGNSGFINTFLRRNKTVYAKLDRYLICAPSTVKVIVTQFVKSWSEVLSWNDPVQLTSKSRY